MTPPRPLPGHHPDKARLLGYYPIAIGCRARDSIQLTRDAQLPCPCILSRDRAGICHHSSHSHVDVTIPPPYIPCRRTEQHRCCPTRQPPKQCLYRYTPFSTLGGSMPFSRRQTFFGFANRARRGHTVSSATTPQQQVKRPKQPHALEPRRKT